MSGFTTTLFYKTLGSQSLLLLTCRFARGSSSWKDARWVILRIFVSTCIIYCASTRILRVRSLLVRSLLVLSIMARAPTENGNPHALCRRIPACLQLATSAHSKTFRMYYTLQTLTTSADEFIDSFSEKLKSLLHSFIAKQQSSSQTHLKSELQLGEFIVTVDFSENYSFVLQNAAQGFHWNNS